MKSRDINFRQRTFYSDKNIRKADYRVVTVFQYNLFGEDEEPIKISKTRNGKEKLTCPAKQILNDKKSELYFELLLKGNFSENDYVLRLSYSDKYLPATEEEAEENVKKYIRDLRKAAKKRGIEKLDYVYVTETGSRNGRIHHHMVLKNVLPRDLVEDLWSKQVRPFHPERERLGWANVKRIQIAGPEMKGDGPDFMKRIARYLVKRVRQSAGKRRWKQSIGLVLPGTTKTDHVCTKKQFEQLSLFDATSFEDCNTETINFIKKHHKGFVLTELRRDYNELTRQFYIRFELMRRNVWLRAHSIFSDQQLAQMDMADEYLLPRKRKRKQEEIQGRLW